MESTRPHITVCICTFKRPALLEQLLSALERQQTDGRFTFDVVVADNDAGGSARVVVEAVSSESPLAVCYGVEPRQNIALARNLALSLARGDLLAFIDDDEVPNEDWLLQLFVTRERYQVDGVLGPVVSHFEQEPPAWVRRGRFFDRRRHATGTPVNWPEARTGNVLIRNGIWGDDMPAFRSVFDSGGEDVDFFRRLAAQGKRFVWCDEAVVREIVPAHRCTRRFLIQRALLRGSNFPKQSGHRLRNVSKSLVAVPCYATLLPILLLAGHHHFVSYLVKLLDHASRLAALAGWRFATERQG